LHHIHQKLVEVKPVVDGGSISAEKASTARGGSSNLSRLDTLLKTLRTSQAASGSSESVRESGVSGAGRGPLRSAWDDRNAGTRRRDNNSGICDRPESNDQQRDRGDGSNSRCGGAGSEDGCHSSSSSWRGDRQQSTSKRPLPDSSADECANKVQLKSVCVTGLPESVRVGDIKRHFLRYGNLTHVASSWSDEHCELMFERAEEARSVLKDYDRHWIHGKWIECSVCGTFGFPDSKAHASVDKLSIFVGGLPQNMAVDRLKEHFRQFGKITRVDMRDKGFAFITFTSGADVQLALHSYKDHFIEEKWVEVKPMRLSNFRGGGGGNSAGAGCGSGGASGPGAQTELDGVADKRGIDGGRSTSGGDRSSRSARHGDDPVRTDASKSYSHSNSGRRGSSAGEPSQASRQEHGSSWRGRPY